MLNSGHSDVTSQPVSFPLHPVLGGMLSLSLGMPSRREGPPSIWDTHGISVNVFADPVASSTTPHPQELNPWSSGREETIHSSTAEKNENQTPVQDQRCQARPLATKSVIFSEGERAKNDSRVKEAEVPEESPSGRMSRLPCKDYVEGTCTNSFYEEWHLQNVCSTRPGVVASLGKIARMLIVRLMNNLVKGPRRMMTKKCSSHVEEV